MSLESLEGPDPAGDSCTGPITQPSPTLARGHRSLIPPAFRQRFYQGLTGFRTFRWL